MRAARPWTSKRRLGLSLAAALLGCAAAEAVARTFAPPRLERPRQEGEILRESDVAERGVELEPGSEMRMVFTRPDGLVEVVHHRVGPHGFRGAPFAREKAPGVTRVACVGDSIVFGWGVGEDQCWPALLGRSFAERGASVEVLNLGVPNIDVEQQVARVERECVEFDCDVVVFALHYDDLLLDGLEQPPSWSHSRLQGWLRPGKSSALDAVRRNLRSVDLVLEGLRTRLGAASYVERQLELARAGQPGRARLDRALARLAEISREHGFETHVIVMPLPVRRGSGWVSDEIDAEFAESARAAGLSVCDVGPALARARGALWVHPLDLHINAVGHAALAKRVLECLVDADVSVRHERVVLGR